MMPDREKARIIMNIKVDTRNKCVYNTRSKIWHMVVESTTTAIPYNIRSIINFELVMEKMLPYP